MIVVIIIKLLIISTKNKQISQHKIQEKMQSWRKRELQIWKSTTKTKLISYHMKLFFLLWMCFFTRGAYVLYLVGSFNFQFFQPWIRFNFQTVLFICWWKWFIVENRWQNRRIIQDFYHIRQILFLICLYTNKHSILKIQSKCKCRFLFQGFFNLFHI